MQYPSSILSAKIWSLRKSRFGVCSRTLSRFRRSVTFMRLGLRPTSPLTHLFLCSYHLAYTPSSPVVVCSVLYIPFNRSFATRRSPDVHMFHNRAFALPGAARSQPLSTARFVARIRDLPIDARFRRLLCVIDMHKRRGLPQRVFDESVNSTSVSNLHHQFLQSHYGHQTASIHDF